MRDGEAVLYEEGADATPITGLSDNTVYWAHVIDANTISLHNSRADALSDTSRVGLTDTASSTTNSLTPRRIPLLISASGTYNLVNCFFDQSGPIDIECIHDSGTVTINVSGGGTSPNVEQRPGTNGTFALNVNVTVTLTGLVNGTEVTVYDVSDGSLVAEVENVTGNQFQFTYDAADGS